MSLLLWTSSLHNPFLFWLWWTESWQEAKWFQMSFCHHTEHRGDSTEKSQWGYWNSWVTFRTPSTEWLPTHPFRPTHTLKQLQDLPFKGIPQQTLVVRHIHAHFAKATPPRNIWQTLFSSLHWENRVVTTWTAWWERSMQQERSK